MVRGADQHRLLPQRDALLAVGQDPLAHRVDLGVLVGAPHEIAAASPPGAHRRRAAREARRRVLADGVGDVEDRLGRPVVALQHDRGDGGERGVDVEQVARAGAPEAVDACESSPTTVRR